MLKKIVVNFKEKSLKERFLLVMGMMFFVLYLGLGLVLIFWNNMPVAMEPKYRIAFGMLLVIYSYFRFTRFFNSQRE